jgi:hypothetical protein
VKFTALEPAPRHLQREVPLRSQVVDRVAMGT